MNIEKKALNEQQRRQAEYIERMSQELSRIAGTSGFAFLVHLLEMVTEEAALMRQSGLLSAAPVSPGLTRRPRDPTQGPGMIGGPGNGQ